jgi:hypothetical protein
MILNLKEINYKLIGQGSFLDGVEALKEKKCDIIYGPQGGALHLDEVGDVVYMFPVLGDIILGFNIRFSVDNYLSIWRQYVQLH